MKKLFTLLISGLFCCLVLISPAQQRTVKGKVTADDGNPLPGASVSIKGTNLGTITDAEGDYSIDLPQNAEVIVFSFIGYLSAEVVIGSQEVINYQLQLDVTQLEEVVVTAFGIEQEKKALGYAVQQLEAEEILESNQPNVIDALQGRIAGVQINSSGGAPGAGSSIIIRGITSLGPGSNNQPLFVVDGIPISNETVAGNVIPSAGSNAAGGGEEFRDLASAEQFSNTNRAADINPDDIESISILKGAAATALYGLRAANGAVIITTKKGEAGKARINFSTSVSWDNVVTTPDIQTQFREGRQGRIRTVSDGSRSSVRFQTLGPAVSEFDGVFDNFDRFFQTGQTYTNSVSLSGGNEKATYFTSVSRLDQTGVVPNSDWDRTSFKIAGSSSLTEKLKVNGAVTYTNSGGNRSQGGDKSIMSTLNYHTPTFDVNDYINPDGTQNSYAGTIIDNPRYLAEFSTYEDDVDRIVGFVGFNYQPVEWINLSYQVGIDNYSDVRKRIAPPNIDITFQNGGFVVEENINYREINSNLLLSFNHSFTEDFTATFTLGNQITDIRSGLISTRGEGLALAGFFDLSNTANLFTTKDDREQKLVGVFGELKLDYHNMLFLSVTGRNDWTSTLPKDNRSFFYPSVSLGYVFSEQFDLPDVFTYGKIRASWAEVGKDALAYQVGTYFEGVPGSPFLGQSAFRLDDLAGSLTLKPERTTSIEFGADLRFFADRLGLDFTWFRQVSKDQIIPIPVSNTTSLSQFVTNAGEIENKGVEILLHGTPLKKGDFNWDVSLNYSKIENEVLDITPLVDEIIFYEDRPSEIVNKLIVGGSAGDLYGHPYIRDAQGRLIIDENGLPQSALDTLILVGNALPDWTAGLTNTLSWKGFSLSVLLELREGGDLVDTGLRNRLRNGVDARTGIRYEQIVFNGVNESGEVNTIPVLPTGYGNNVSPALYRNESAYVGSSDILLQDASWFRIRNVSLSYNLPSQLLAKLPFTSARLTLAGNNVFLNTPFIGFDPEGSQFGSGANAFGFAGQSIPNTRSYTVKLNFSL